MQQRRHDGMMMCAAVEVVGDEAAVPAVLDSMDFDGEGGGAGGGRPAYGDGELRGLWQRHERIPVRAAEAEAEEAGRVALAEAAEEGRVGGVEEPPLADEGCADEAGGEAEAEQDLAEQVVVAEDRCRRCGRGRRRRPPIAVHVFWGIFAEGEGEGLVS